MSNWTQAGAIQFCRDLEKITPKYGCHVALTGGCLYGGSLKDCDIILYRIRQAPEIKWDEMWNSLAVIGEMKVSGFGFCHKAEYMGMQVDFLSPEEDGSEYPEDSDEPQDELLKQLIDARI